LPFLKWVQKFVNFVLFWVLEETNKI
jgi:hypothetical protein